MTRTVWLNGAFVDGPGHATVSAFDAGVQHGVGLFETMLANATEAAPSGRVFRLAEHLDRLRTSAIELGLMSKLKPRALAEAVDDVVRRSAICSIDRPDARARVRVTVTGGDLNMLAAARSDAERTPQNTDPTIVIEATPAQRYPDEMFERGVAVVIAATKANPLNGFEGHKTLNYWWRLRELQLAALAGAGEALVLMITNHVCGGAVSNLFVVKGGHLLTPVARGEEDAGALPSPVVPGVTRRAVIDLAAGQRVACQRKVLSINDVLDADELFLTNSSFGVLPVTRVERKPIGGDPRHGAGANGDRSRRGGDHPGPGPITRRLRDALAGAVAEEL